MSRKTRLVGLLLLFCTALMVAPHVRGMVSRIAPYLTTRVTAKDDFQNGTGRQPMNADQQSKMQSSYEQDAKKILALDSSKKLSEVRDLIRDLKLKWSPTSGPYYSRLMLDTCKTLNSLDLGDKGQYELAYSSAMEVLAQPHRFPQDAEQKFDVEMGLVLCLNRDLGDPSWNVAPDWQARRRLNAEKFLSLWQRMNNAIDPNFNSEDLPLLNVPPPAGSGVPAGTEPTAISDRAKRAEYEAAIRANREKANAYNLQRKLRSMVGVLEPHLKGYLIAAYSKAPAHITELQELLSQYHVEEPLKRDITEEVQRASP